MSLIKQLFLMVFLLFSLLFLGNFFISVHSVSQFSEAQLNSNAQDTASSLALSLTDSLKQKDTVLIERTIDAIFDRGFYWRITLEDLDGKVVYEKISQSKYGDAPNWLMRYFEIRPKEQTALLKIGWQNAGTLKVVSHPRFLNLQLWEVFKETFGWFMFVGVSSLVLIGILLKIVLKPLSKVVLQAQKICHREFSVQKTLPWTLDFKIVVSAMNKMSTILKKIFEENTHLTEVLKEKVYQDPITKLGNRRYFEEQFAYLLSSFLERQDGALFLIRIRNFTEYKQKWGYKASDSLLKEVANYIRDVGVSRESFVFGSLDGGDFALSIPKVKKNILEDLAQQIIQQFSEFYKNKKSLQAIECAIGVSTYSHGHDPKAVFTSAEFAIKGAEAKDHSGFEILSTFEQNLNLDIDNWRLIFGEILHKQTMTLFQQPIVRRFGSTEEIIEYEILMRCLDGNQQPLSPRNMFVNAKELQVEVLLDKIMLKQVLTVLKQATEKRKNLLYAINLSFETIASEDFFQWLKELLIPHKGYVSALIIELPEVAVRNHFDLFMAFYEIIAPLGVKIGLDHFGRGFSALDYLETLKIDYIKIHGSFIRNIHNNIENQFLVRSFVEMAHGLGVQVIAIGVESELELATLQTLNIDAYQGFLFGRPAPLSI